MRLALAILLTATALAAAPGPAPAPADTLMPYTVRLNDNLYTLAQRYFRRLDDYRTVQALNRVRDPYRLTIGSTLMIPRAVLRATPIDAKLIAFRGAVTLDGQPASLDAPVKLGSRLVTGSNASASIQLPDASTISLPSQSAIRVAALQRYLINGAIDRRFALEAGRTQSIVMPISDPRGTFRISTPLSVSAVRGTDFRVSYDPAKNEGTSGVVGGHVAVTDPKGKAGPLLAAGEGVRATEAGVGDAVKLLKPPALVGAAREQAETKVSFEIEPVAGARAYRVQLSTDDGFLAPFAERTATVPRVEFDGVANGAYFARLTAIDAQGIEGLPTIAGFERRLNVLEASVEQTGPRGYRFRWRAGGSSGPTSIRFRLLKDSAAGLPVIDRAGLGREIAVGDLTAGTYVWQVISTQVDRGRVYERATPFRTLTVGPGGTPPPR